MENNQPTDKKRKRENYKELDEENLKKKPRLNDNMTVEEVEKKDMSTTNTPKNGRF